jgi:hypothetical protein
MLRKLLISLLATMLVLDFVCGYCYFHSVGYPQKVQGRWVWPRVVQWYWTGMPGWPYPGEIQYSYRGPDGRLVPHGSYLRQVWTSHGLQADETGFYLDGEKNGVFTKYQTYWGKPMSREYYEKGKLVRQEFLKSVPSTFSRGR